jgi:flagellar L-ring protein precursor FlgH
MPAKRLLHISLCAIAMMPALHGAPKKKKVVEPSALDKYIQDALSNGGAQTPAQPSAGSLWAPSSRITDLGSDLRAIQINDLVTIVVAEQASAVATGATQTSRKSSVATAVSGSYQGKGVAGSLNSGNDIELNGAGSTSRGTQLSTTLSARVTHVLPNGYLVLEGTKDVQVNSEHQFIKVRGIIRPIDLSPGNIITSTQLAQLEINIDGKGVINDAVHRPNLLYRLILGLLPF